jgi:threonine/homoserine efflux transporter RhtA
MSLSPVAATLSGFVLLGQRFTPLQFLAMATVILASVCTVRANRTPKASGAPSLRSRHRQEVAQ